MRIFHSIIPRREAGALRDEILYGFVEELARAEIFIHIASLRLTNAQVLGDQLLVVRMNVME